MQIQDVGEIGCVYSRVRGKRKRSFDFERRPAIKMPAPNGTVLLRPLAAKPASQPQEPKALRTDGSAQWSPLIAGMGKGKFTHVVAEF